MPCYHPLPGWIGRKRTESGKRSIHFNPADAWTDKKLEIPCGRCIGCRLERARQWAIRCMHEAQLHPSSMFATLTYDDDHLPPRGSLRPRDFVLFMKRLRQARTDGLRYFQCGEYGSNLERPHHHALLFNLELPDKQLLPAPPGAVNLFRSEELDRLWGQGATTVGHVTFESAAYVAGYALKKITGPPAAQHYAGRLPEYCTMSRRPGIGAHWLERFKSDVYPDDSVTIRGGIKCRPPKFYDTRLTERERRRYAKRREEQRRDRTGRQLITSEAVVTARTLARAARPYEESKR